MPVNLHQINCLSCSNNLINSTILLLFLSNRKLRQLLSANLDEVGALILIKSFEMQFRCNFLILCKKGSRFRVPAYYFNYLISKSVLPTICNLFENKNKLIMTLMIDIKAKNINLSKSVTCEYYLVFTIAFFLWL